MKALTKNVKQTALINISFYFTKKALDQYQYLDNCAPTLPSPNML